MASMMGSMDMDDAFDFPLDETPMFRQRVRRPARGLLSWSTAAIRQLCS